MGNNDTGTTSLSGEFAGTVFGGMQFGGVGSYLNPVPPVTGANHLRGDNFFGNMQFGGAGTYYDMTILTTNKIGWGFIIQST
jgi:hypothetical protein